MARLLAFLLLLLCLAGCAPGGGALEAGFGERGMHPGQFVRPRALAALPTAPDGELYCIDFSGRIQVFDLQGQFKRQWKTPAITNGRPAALALAPDGKKVVVADSHYQRALVYTPEGESLGSIDGLGSGGPAEFGYVAGVAVGPDGSIYVSEFGDGAAVHRFSPEGKHLLAWGSQGKEPGQFGRPRGLAVTPGGEVVVADSCNHRLQLFTPEGKLVRAIGRQGEGPGEFSYPYSVAVGRDGSLFVVEFGNHRVQRLSPTGEPLGMWGGPGRTPGLLHSPWGIAVDGVGTVWVADTENHRLQKIRF